MDKATTARSAKESLEALEALEAHLDLQGEGQEALPWWEATWGDWRAWEAFRSLERAISPARVASPEVWMAWEGSGGGGVSRLRAALEALL